MTIKELVKKYIQENGYSGLLGDKCGCEINDLMPCGEPQSDCELGYKFSHETLPKDDCDCDCENIGDWHIQIDQF